MGKTDAVVVDEELVVVDVRCVLEDVDGVVSFELLCEVLVDDWVDAVDCTLVVCDVLDWDWASDVCWL